MKVHSFIILIIYKYNVYNYIDCDTISMSIKLNNTKILKIRVIL